LAAGPVVFIVVLQAEINQVVERVIRCVAIKVRDLAFLDSPIPVKAEAHAAAPDTSHQHFALNIGGDGLSLRHAWASERNGGGRGPFALPIYGT
jgi:hypothetical protein